MTVAIQRIERQMRAVLPHVLRNWPPKAIAKLVDATPRAAKAWKEGDCLPQAVHMTALEMALPEFAEEMRRIRALPGENPIPVADLAKQLAQALKEQAERP